MRLVFCNCPDLASAEHIAEALVRARLAACVNVIPGIRSFYRWQGQLERAEETLLLIKTVFDRVEALSEQIVALHPYELPEVIAVEVDSGLPAYLRWVAEQSCEED